MLTVITISNADSSEAWWLRRCATCRTVPGSIPGGVTGFFSDIFLSDQTMALGSTQPLVKMSTTNIPGGKGDRCVKLTKYHHTVPLSRNLGALTSLTPLGLHGPLWESVTFTSLTPIPVARSLAGIAGSNIAGRRAHVVTAVCRQAEVSASSGVLSTVVCLSVNVRPQ